MGLDQYGSGVTGCSQGDIDDRVHDCSLKEMQSVGQLKLE